MTPIFEIARHYFCCRALSWIIVLRNHLSLFENLEMRVVDILYIYPMFWGIPRNTGGIFHKHHTMHHTHTYTAHASMLSVILIKVNMYNTVLYLVTARLLLYE